MDFWPDSVFGWASLAMNIAISAWLLAAKPVREPRWLADNVVHTEHGVFENDATRNDSARRASADFSGIREERAPCPDTPEYRCPVCGEPGTTYMRCYRPDCVDGR